MNISGIKGYSFSNKGLTKFKGNENTKASGEYYNPVNVKTERKLAILSSVGISAVAGAIGAGLTSVITGSSLFKKIPMLAGAAVAAITFGLSLPSRLYHTKVNATVKEKEMGVFTADRELKKDLTQNVHQEVKDPDVSLDKKLDDNLKLQLANRAAMVGFKNV